MAIDPALLSFYLFVRPAYGHYYFGDYFADEYVGLGIYPWYEVNRIPDYGYDPLLAYDRWYYKTRDPEWIHNLERWNTYYRQHPEARPPHDLAAEQKIAAQIKARPDREFALIARPLGTVWQNSIFPMKLARLSLADRNRIIENVRGTRDFQAQRLRMETVSAGRTTDQLVETDVNSPATASGRPQKAALPYRAQAIMTSRESGGPRGPATAPTSLLPRYDQRETFAGPVVSAESRLGTQGAIARGLEASLAPTPTAAAQGRMSRRHRRQSQNPRRGPIEDPRRTRARRFRRGESALAPILNFGPHSLLTRNDNRATP